jgi:cell division protease FtsH
MMVLLGGRAAEHVVFNELSTGATDDLAKVTDIARSMVMRYGMDEKLGNLAYERERTTFLEMPQVIQERSYSEDTAREIDRAVREIVQSAFQETVQLLTQHRSLLEEGAVLLLEKETLGEEELARLRAKVPLPTVSWCDRGQACIIA